jgi:GNAT superfamily N-acetyltransferase
MSESPRPQTARSLTATHGGIGQDGYRIRPWTPTDLEPVIELITAIQQREFGLQITTADQPDLIDVQAYYRDPGGELWVASRGPMVVGTIAAINIGNGQIALRKLFVAAADRGGRPSLATRLMDRLRDWAADREVRDIYLGTTSRMHAAHRFYERHGFIEIDKHQLAGPFPVMAVDSRFYRLRLRNREAHPRTLPARPWCHR